MARHQTAKQRSNVKADAHPPALAAPAGIDKEYTEVTVPKSLDLMLLEIASVAEEFIRVVELCCERSVAGDHVAATCLPSLWDKWRRLDCQALMAIAYVPQDQYAPMPLPGGQGTILGLRPGPFRELADLLTALRTTDPLPERSLGPAVIRGSAIAKISALAAEFRRMAALPFGAPAPTARGTPARGTPAEPDDLITQQAAADFVEVHAKTIRQRIKEGVLTRYSKGRVSRAQVVQNRLQLSERKPRARRSPART